MGKYRTRENLNMTNHFGQIGTLFKTETHYVIYPDANGKGDSPFRHYNIVVGWVAGTSFISARRPILSNYFAVILLP
jgi:hypothetical protein